LTLGRSSRDSGFSTMSMNYIPLAAAIIGAITIVPRLTDYFAGKKHRRNMAKQMDELNRIYDITHSGDQSAASSKEA
jgi:predicted deacylase